MNPNKGRGQGINFLRAHLAHTGAECVLWPYSKLPKGYGTLGWNGQVWRAHRLMCVLAHGEPPTPAHHAAHSCHIRLCVNPNHLRWATSSENHFDQRDAGTGATSRGGRHGYLEPIQVQMIRALRGVATQAAIAEQFGVSEETIRRIHNGTSYANVAA